MIMDKYIRSVSPYPVLLSIFCQMKEHNANLHQHLETEKVGLFNLFIHLSLRIPV